VKMTARSLFSTSISDSAEKSIPELRLNWQFVSSF